MSRIRRLTSSIPLVEPGFIIGCGLLLDTFVVRTLTVPARSQLSFHCALLDPRTAQTLRERPPQSADGERSTDVIAVGEKLCR